MADQFKFKAKYDMKKINALARMRGARGVKVGVLSGAGTHPSSKSLSIAAVAWLNEFGTGSRREGYVAPGGATPSVRRGSPPRPFLRTTMYEHDYYRAELRAAIKTTLLTAARMQREVALPLQVLGQLAADDVRQKITTGPWTPNASSTIRKKTRAWLRRLGGEKSKPLIDRGVLRQSIKWALYHD